jgi:hypothetical protein
VALPFFRFAIATLEASTMVAAWSISFVLDRAAGFLPLSNRRAFRKQNLCNYSLRMC